MVYPNLENPNACILPGINAIGKAAAEAGCDRVVNLVDSNGSVDIEKMNADPNAKGADHMSDIVLN